MTTKVVIKDYFIANYYVTIQSIGGNNMETILQKNIKKYMDKEGIRYYSDLLFLVGKRLGQTSAKAREFSEREKSNFSKMLKGERPLKYDYIIPLEKIFGVPLAKLLEDDIYLGEVNKEDIPFLKSFRYYAYKDELSLYEELDKLATNDGEEIINNSDEYNKFFLDYLIEYHAFNGLKYLVNQHNFHFNSAYLYETDTGIMVFSVDALQVAKFVIDSNDAEIFNFVYHPFEEPLLFQYKDQKNIIYTQQRFIEAIVNNNRILESLFIEKKISFELLNKGIQLQSKEKPDIYWLNPLLNLCLDYCLQNIAIYREQAKKILDFGIKHNQIVKSRLSSLKYRWFVDGFGNICFGNRCYYTNLVFTKIKETEDEEIRKMIHDLSI